MARTADTPEPAEWDEDRQSWGPEPVAATPPPGSEPAKYNENTGSFHPDPVPSTLPPGHPSA
ncbi:hypothetical protein ACQPZP_02650 [Spirillospora sp. CA-142024]|uniref:hypothetical protein n=1 Tax=Spirillospora sp. CA-142024 TaxID=3240036 RepID=UPI003D89F87B